ncbi:hypothetical protein KUCAC02_011278 [Chaenocephalus aceratus]|uniref:Uncharacterized protein n=1 Tax=Chaenocephalus aceratus TaxID=36190 RepID=A0ACB9WVA5_CHAAC|nr:hypothetical protein KUCAC02_011278 [Chaenocephalus aceratus]
MVCYGEASENFHIQFTDPSKTFYCGGGEGVWTGLSGSKRGDRVSAVKLLALGSAKVEYAKGKQRCRQAGRVPPT